MRWRVVYVDGTMFDSSFGAPQDAPGAGVAAVVQEDAVVGVAIHYGKDFYIYDDERYGGWCAVDYFGLGQYLMDPGLKVVKLGDNMTTERYRLLLDQLRKDPFLPRKSARYPWEAPF